MDVQNFVNVFESYGRYLYNFFNNVDSMYVATFIFFSILIYAIMLSVIGRISGLGTDQKANKYGKVVALAIALITSFATFKLGPGTNAKDIVSKVLVTYGIFAGAVLSLLFFAIIYYGLGNKEEGRWHLSVIGAGFLMVVFGFFISKPMVQATGWLIGIVGLILYISTAGLLSEATDKTEKK
jgi:hypothetical protein